jgi:hypothetical protein
MYINVAEPYHCRGRRTSLSWQEHVEGDGATEFEHACKLSLEGIVTKTQGMALQLGPLAALAQVEEPDRRRCAGRLRRNGVGRPKIATEEAAALEIQNTSYWQECDDQRDMRGTRRIPSGLAFAPALDGPFQSR